MNYIEAFITEKNNVIEEKNVSILDTQLSLNTFCRLLDNMSKQKSPFKFFKRSMKSYVHKNIYLDNINQQDIQVYTKCITKIDTLQRMPFFDVKAIYYEKEKKHYHTFPSTLDIHAITYTHRLIFRINNHVYLNFDHVQNKEKTRYNVFFNINCEKNIDLQNDLRLVENVLTMLV